MAAAAHGPPQAAGHGAAPPPENDVGDAQDGWEQAAPTLVGVSCRADFHVLRSMWRPRARRLRPEPHTSAPDGRAWGESTPLVPSDVSQLALEQRMREMPAVQTALAHDKLLMRIPAMLEAMFMHALADRGTTLWRPAPAQLSKSSRKMLRKRRAGKYDDDDAARSVAEAEARQAVCAAEVDAVNVIQASLPTGRWLAMTWVERLACLTVEGGTEHLAQPRCPALLWWRNAATMQFCCVEEVALEVWRTAAREARSARMMERKRATLLPLFEDWRNAANDHLEAVNVAAGPNMHTPEQRLRAAAAGLIRMPAASADVVHDTGLFAQGMRVGIGPPRDPPRGGPHGRMGCLDTPTAWRALREEAPPAATDAGAREEWLQGCALAEKHACALDPTAAGAPPALSFRVVCDGTKAENMLGMVWVCGGDITAQPEKAMRAAADKEVVHEGFGGHDIPKCYEADLLLSTPRQGTASGFAALFAVPAQTLYVLDRFCQCPFCLQVVAAGDCESAPEHKAPVQPAAAPPRPSVAGGRRTPDTALWGAAEQALVQHVVNSNVLMRGCEIPVDTKALMLGLTPHTSKEARARLNITSGRADHHPHGISDLQVGRDGNTRGRRMLLACHQCGTRGCARVCGACEPAAGDSLHPVHRARIGVRPSCVHKLPGNGKDRCAPQPGQGRPGDLRQYRTVLFGVWAQRLRGRDADVVARHKEAARDEQGSRAHAFIQARAQVRDDAAQVPPVPPFVQAGFYLFPNSDGEKRGCVGYSPSDVSAHYFGSQNKAAITNIVAPWAARARPSALMRAFATEAEAAALVLAAAVYPVSCVEAEREARMAVAANLVHKTSVLLAGLSDAGLLERLWADAEDVCCRQEDDAARWDIVSLVADQADAAMAPLLKATDQALPLYIKRLAADNVFKRNRATGEAENPALARVVQAVTSVCHGPAAARLHKHFDYMNKVLVLDVDNETCLAAGHPRDEAFMPCAAGGGAGCDNRAHTHELHHCSSSGKLAGVWETGILCVEPGLFVRTNFFSPRTLVLVAATGVKVPVAEEDFESDAKSSLGRVLKAMFVDYAAAAKVLSAAQSKSPRGADGAFRSWQDETRALQELELTACGQTAVWEGGSPAGGVGGGVGVLHLVEKALGDASRLGSRVVLSNQTGGGNVEGMVARGWQHAAEERVQKQLDRGVWKCVGILQPFGSVELPACDTRRGVVTGVLEDVEKAVRGGVRVDFVAEDGVSARSAVQVDAGSVGYLVFMPDVTDASSLLCAQMLPLPREAGQNNKSGAPDRRQHFVSCATGATDVGRLDEEGGACPDYDCALYHGLLMCRDPGPPGRRDGAQTKRMRSWAALRSVGPQAVSFVCVGSALRQGDEAVAAGTPWADDLRAVVRATVPVRDGAWGRLVVLKRKTRAAHTEIEQKLSAGMWAAVWVDGLVWVPCGGGLSLDQASTGGLFKRLGRLASSVRGDGAGLDSIIALMAVNRLNGRRVSVPEHETLCDCLRSLGHRMWVSGWIAYASGVLGRQAALAQQQVAAGEIRVGSVSDDITTPGRFLATCLRRRSFAVVQHMVGPACGTSDMYKCLEAVRSLNSNGQRWDCE